MHLDLLKTFKAVNDRGTTLGAAELLNVSQSAISRRISQLEEELGLRLYQRDKNRLIRTRENLNISSYIQELLDQAGKMAERANELRLGDLPALNLRIAVPASLAQSFLPAIMVELQTSFPQLQAEVHFGAYDTIERMLTDGRAEVGFLRLPFQRPGLRSMPLAEAETVAVMHRDHPLARYTMIRATDLENEPLILLGRARAPRREIDEMFRAARVSPRVRMETHSVMSACAFAAHGLGITLVNELMARDFSHLPIVIRPMRERMVHHFAFATTEGLPLSQTAEAFVAVASRHMQNALERMGQRGGTGDAVKLSADVHEGLSDGT